MRQVVQEDACRAGTPPAVRRAVPGDAEALERLIVLLAAHHGDRATVGQDSLRADLFASPPWAVALVAEGDGGILGYALLVRLYRAQFARRIMDLHHLFVAPEARGRGVGVALVHAAAREAEAQGCAHLAVGTDPDNHRAQAFYRRLGFEDVPPAAGPRFRLPLGTSR